MKWWRLQAKSKEGKTCWVSNALVLLSESIIAPCLAQLCWTVMNSVPLSACVNSCRSIVFSFVFYIFKKMWFVPIGFKIRDTTIAGKLMRACQDQAEEISLFVRSAWVELKRLRADGRSACDCCVFVNSALKGRPRSHTVRTKTLVHDKEYNQKVVKDQFWPLTEQ